MNSLELYLAVVAVSLLFGGFAILFGVVIGGLIDKLLEWMDRHE